MPVIYTAVGRILGYPLYLVETRVHLFFRWSDPEGTRFGYPDGFNVEGTGVGIHAYSDDHYREWPEPWTDKDPAAGCYLRPLSPKQELAAFLVTRAECLIENRRFDEALQAYTWACSLAPDDIRYQRNRRNQEARAFRKLEHEAWIREEDRKRRMEFLEGPEKRKQKTPPHGPYCRCMQCAEARKPPAPPHGDSCQCMDCRRARHNIEQSQTPPGHPPGCCCVKCSRPKAPFDPFAPAKSLQPFNPFGPHKPPWS